MSHVLSQREYQVLGCIVSGKRLKDISVDLGLKQSTIATYKHRLMEKLHVTNVIDLLMVYQTMQENPGLYIRKEESPLLSQATAALNALFKEHDIDLAKITNSNRGIHRQIILHKFSYTADHTKEEVDHLYSILLYLSTL